VKVLHIGHNLFAGTETLSLSVSEPIAMHVLCCGVPYLLPIFKILLTTVMSAGLSVRTGKDSEKTEKPNGTKLRPMYYLCAALHIASRHGTSQAYSV
jgi:hypothetical protein